MSQVELWISKDFDGWAFWSAKPKPNHHGEFIADVKQTKGVNLVNEFTEHQVECVITDGQTAKVCLESPVTIDEAGRFVVPVVTATIEGPTA